MSNKEHAIASVADRGSNLKDLPIGRDSFEEIRYGGFYYVDKTGLVKALLQNRNKVTLFTRPRRFGKTLNMRMLQSFFEVGTDRSLFDGLEIASEQKLCEEYLGKYPVVFLTLKDVDGLNFASALHKLRKIVQEEADRIFAKVGAQGIFESVREDFFRLYYGKASLEDIQNSLRLFTRILCRFYNQKVILLIDEYDVPLDKAFNHGYYEEMVSCISGLFGQALKSNDFLHFAVLTGCLRISKESIFTGLNNFFVDSIVENRFNEYFGFTDGEVRGLLAYYGFSSRYDVAKEWYDGYRFGGLDVYCPWDVVNYAGSLRADASALPQPYWINTSGNALVRRFIDRADKTTQNELERLIAGEPIEKAINLNLTYNEIDNSIDNLWSVLFTTGYLTSDGRSEGGGYRLKIPNREVREIFVQQIQAWFKERFVHDVQSMQEFCHSFLTGDVEAIQERLNLILSRMISVLDNRVRREQKENFYHGLLLGLLRSETEWLILSNVESGDGFCDIMVEPDDLDTGFVIEVKYAESIDKLEKACNTALQQIRQRRYDERLRNEGRSKIRAFGIAFCRKRCRVACADC